jgi:hypothetical protein
MCELGNQHICKHCRIPYRTGKKYFESLGVEHISIDINNKDGALKRDLSKPIDEWHNYFDIVTNYGTAEHVQNGQYEVFQNIHNFVRVGGAIVSVGPFVGYWKNHCPYHYRDNFFQDLANKNNYKIILNEVRKRGGRKIQYSHFCVFIKEQDTEFITLDDFEAINGIKGYRR